MAHTSLYMPWQYGSATVSHSYIIQFIVVKAVAPLNWVSASAKCCLANFTTNILGIQQQLLLHSLASAKLNPKSV